MSRPLLPNGLTGLPDAQGQSQQPTSPDGAPSPSSSGHKPTYSKRGKITIVACVPCRKRKTKCDGKRPACGQCVARDGSCGYDMTDDQRKLTYLRDNVEQLQEKSSSLETLFHTVQTASEEEAAEVYRRLRTSPDINAIAEHVQFGRLLSGVSKSSVSSSNESPYANEQSAAHDRIRQYDSLMAVIANSDSSASQDIVRRIKDREDVYSIIRSVQTGGVARPQPLLRQSGEGTGLESIFSSEDQTFGLVKGTEMRSTHAITSSGTEFQVGDMRGPWTRVTDDKDFVEHLITSYFTWQHSFFQNFPENLFRADMAAGRTKYCSDILVNAICAAGCFISTRKLSRADRGDGHTMVSSFFDECVRLLNLIDTPSITTTAALYLMSYVEGTRGRLSNLWMFSGRSVLTALDINLHLKQRGKWATDLETAEEMANEEKARLYAFWGCFHVDQTTSFTLGRLPNLNIHGVTVDLPHVIPEDDAAPWEAFEMNLPPKVGVRATSFNRCAALSRIVNSTLRMFFAPVVPFSGSLLLEEYEKYLQWKRTLPSSVASIKDAVPHVLCLHMYYHATVMLLFRPFLKATIVNSNLVPREVCREAANAISDIWCHHREMYGLAGIYMFQVHCLLTACTIHIINLPTIAATKAFTEACNTFQALVDRNEWARSSLTILRDLVEKWNLILPQEAEEALYRDQETARALPHRASLRPGSLESRLPLTDERSETPHGRSPSVDLRSGRGASSQQDRSPPQAHFSPAGPSHPYHVQPKRSPLIDGEGEGFDGGDAKRQRVSAPNNRLNHIITGGPRQGPPQSPSNYLYSPLANQPAPLLIPVRANSDSGNGGEIGAKDGQKQVEGEGGGKRKGRDEMHGIQDAVEGLNFGDDWRDPFMGYLGQHT